MGKFSAGVTFRSRTHIVDGIDGACALPVLHAPARAANVQATERRRCTMAWTTPTLVEICIGLEINGYLPAEF
jgi:coenzyme PQQ precursor peptide PqqA